MISVMFTEPPSVDGTAGPQIDPADAAPADDAVVLAVLDDELRASPGSCTATSGSVDEGALIDLDELDRLAVPVADPSAVEFVWPLAADSFAVDPVADVPEVDEVGALVESDVVPPSGLVVVVVGVPGVTPVDVLGVVVPGIVPCMLSGKLV